MADVNNIKLSPEQMEAKAAEFNTRCEEFNQVVSTMRNMVTSLCDEWAGHSSQAFYDQFQSLEPSFTATSDLSHQLHSSYVMYPQQCRASTRKSQGKLERCSSREPSGFSRRLFENMRNVCMGKMDDTGKALEKNINSNIEFDTSVLQEKNETYSSLTDTYGIDLFTDQYEEKIEKVHLKEYDAYQKIEKKLFETDLESGKDEYERIQDQLFLYTGSEVKSESMLMDTKVALSNESTADKFIDHIIVCAKSGTACSEKGAIRGDVYNAFVESEEGKNVESEIGMGSMWISSHPAIDEVTGYDSDEYALSLVTVLKNNSNKSVGYIIIDVKTSFIQDILDNAQISDNSIKGFVLEDGSQVLS